VSADAKILSVVHIRIARFLCLCMFVHIFTRCLFFVTNFLRAYFWLKVP